jgi:hypothetical protein
VADGESAFSLIDKIVENVAREQLNNEESQLRWLQSWWSKTYSRPLKDPLLADYTIEELYYEYRLTVERVKASEEKAEEEGDKMEQAKVDDALAWAEAEEAKESASVSGADKEWMEKQLQEAKQLYGEDFGESISEEF